MSKKLFTSTFTHEGKRYYVRSSKSQREADKKAAIRQRELEENTEILSPNTTVEQYALLWLETYKEGKVSEPTRREYLANINNHIIPAIGKMKLKDVRPIHLQRIVNARKGMARVTYEKLRHTMKQIFRQARRDRLIREDPAEVLEIPKSTSRTRRSLTEDERRAVLYVADWHSFGLLVLTTLWCGLRPQEAAALRWEDVDMVNRRLYIKRALKADGRIAETKTKAGKRSVPIPPQLWERMRLPDSGYVFTTPGGGQYSRRPMRSAWDAFRRQVDIALGARMMDGAITQSVIARDLTMYCMRHTYCTDLQAAGVPINVARDLMGHTSIEITARIYTHMRDDVMDDAAAKIAAYGATVGATLSSDKPPISAVIQERKEDQSANNKPIKSV